MSTIDWGLIRRARGLPAARLTDPITSWEAAASVTGMTETQIAVLDTLEGYGPTCDEDLIGIIQSTGHKASPSGIRSRRKELVDAGLVRDSGRFVVGSTGRRMILWEIVPRDPQMRMGL